jgi:tetratricopeptide (TPR) repeat protein
MPGGGTLEAVFAGRSTLLALLVCALTAGGVRAAEPPMSLEAKVWYEEAMRLYAARDYRAAVSAFEAAYALDPRREILFGQAQAARLAGDCAAALPLYERFLATQPPPQQVEATRIGVARCAAMTAAAQAARAAAPPVIVAPAPQPPRWYQDRAGAVLTGVGLVGLGAGAALIASAGAADEEARAVQSRYDDYAAQRAKAERRWGWGLASLIAGSALVATGVGRYVWVMVHPQGGGGVGAGARF